jgi:hypothetical protein
LTEQSPKSERLAIKESLALNGRGGLDAGCNQASGTPFKIYTGKRLFDLKRPRFSSLRIDMSPIVEAECDVAVLLDFKDNNVVAQSVNSSRRDKNGVAWFGDDAHQAISNRAASVVPQ